MSLIGCSNNAVDNKALNEKSIVELAEDMAASKICQDSNLKPTLNESMSRVYACLEYVEKQTAIFENIQAAESNRERQRYKKASKQLLEDTIAALNE